MQRRPWACVPLAAAVSGRYSEAARNTSATSGELHGPRGKLLAGNRHVNGQTRCEFGCVGVAQEYGNGTPGLSDCPVIE